jgi:hypothetical protein
VAGSPTNSGIRVFRVLLLSIFSGGLLVLFVGFFGRTGGGVYLTTKKQKTPTKHTKNKKK